MAKLLFAKSSDDTVRVYTLSRPIVGQKVLFLDDETAGNILSVYDDSTPDEVRKWGNGIKCIVASDTLLRPHIIPMTDFMARSSVLIDNCDTPQLRHKATERIACIGPIEAARYGKNRKVVSVGATYNVVPKRKDGEPYSWTTLGLDETDETYQIKDGKIVFGELSITIEECLKHFEDKKERENNRLNPPQAQTAK